MSQEDDRYRKWGGLCPRCKVVRVTAESFPCQNCGAASVFNIDLLRQIECANSCGWSLSILTCPMCKAKIQGRFLGAAEPKKGGFSHPLVNFIGYSAILALISLVAFMIFHR